MAAAAPQALKGELHILPNEYNQEETLRYVKGLGPRYTKIVGCSCYFSLNVASLLPSITHIAIFDISIKVQAFWQEFKALMENPQTTQAQVERWGGDFAKRNNYRIYEADLEGEKTRNWSWLSTPERFERIHKIFLNRGFTFDLVDFSTPEFATYFKREHQTPCIFYPSNIHLCLDEEVDSVHIKNSFKAIPPGSLIIYSENEVGGEPAIQKISNGPALDIFLSSHEMASRAMDRDNYDGLALCIQKGLNTKYRYLKGESYLANCMMKNKINALRALIEVGKMDVNDPDGKNLMPMDHAIMYDRSDMIIYLTLQKADLSCRFPDGSTLLHFAAENLSLKAAQTLLELKANPKAKNEKGLTPYIVALKAVPRDADESHARTQLLQLLKVKKR